MAAGDYHFSTIGGQRQNLHVAMYIEDRKVWPELVNIVTKLIALSQEPLIRIWCFPFHFLEGQQETAVLSTRQYVGLQRQGNRYRRNKHRQRQ